MQQIRLTVERIENGSIILKHERGKSNDRNLKNHKNIELKEGDILEIIKMDKEIILISSKF